MERKRLTKTDIDSVRNLDGFPVGDDKNIIALSDPPFYTACPNPFIAEYIEKYGHAYSEVDDNYHREPYASDVSEGKHDPLYMVHGYHTKVPYKAIMKYILHYTEPGDIVLDGFCGTGMTGVAAQMCGQNNGDNLGDIGELGNRHAILTDLSTEAAFIAYNYNNSADLNKFHVLADKILVSLKNEYGWMYETKDPYDSSSVGKRTINYTIWSDIYVCPICGSELKYWDISVNEDESVIETPRCPKCDAIINKNTCDRVIEQYIDPITGEMCSKTKQYIVKINYTVGKKHYFKKPDEQDLEVINKINRLKIYDWYPNDLMMGKGEQWGDSWRAGYHLGITRVYQFYTKRNLMLLAKCNSLIEEVDDIRIKKLLKFWMSSIYSRSHILNRYMPTHHRHVGPLSGTLYVPFFQAEINIIELLEEKLSSIMQLSVIHDNSCVSTQSSTNLSNIPTHCVDYIFVDPPFGDNLNYSELNFIQEAWLKCKTNNSNEAIINTSQGKALNEYQDLITRCFTEFYRVLKPGRWITVEFHNSQNVVWNAIQEAINKAGFIIADIRTLDKQKGTTKQLSSFSTVQQDLIISAYKPKEAFVRAFIEKAGSEEEVWDFVRQHLKNLPVAPDGDNNGKIDIVTERKRYLLFDRMVAWHIMHGVSIPVSSNEFYTGLDEHFLERDGMYFLPEQVNEYDQKRSFMELENIQEAFAIVDEKGAIQWLNYQLKEPQSYAELQPKYLQELHQLRTEKMPELLDLLNENFLKDENGKWYIPDVRKAGDVEKLRQKSLLKEFDSYLLTKGKLKVYRSEAIKAGFSRLWKEKDYKNIVAIAERLPDQTIQEDPTLLMYYDISLSRV